MLHSAPPANEGKFSSDPTPDLPKLTTSSPFLMEEHSLLVTCYHGASPSREPESDSVVLIRNNLKCHVTT